MPKLVYINSHYGHVTSALLTTRDIFVISIDLPTVVFNNSACTTLN